MASNENSEIVCALHGLLPRLKDEFGVGKLWIAGSRARGDHRDDSDLDVIAEFERRGISLLTFCRLERTLAELVGLKVDLVEEGAVHPLVAASLAVAAILV